MPYSAEISRRQPSCFLFLIDQSGSMADAFSNNSASKGTAKGAYESLHKTSDITGKSKNGEFRTSGYTEAGGSVLDSMAT